VPDTSGGCAIIQRDLVKLLNWANSTVMQVNKGKGKVLPMERNNLIHTRGQAAGQHHCREGPGDPSGQQSEHEPAMHPQAIGSLHCMRKTVASQAREEIFPLFLLAPVRP